MSDRGNRYAEKEELKISGKSFSFRELELLERLAELEHEQWAHWTQYFLDNYGKAGNPHKWRLQALTSYYQLSEKEKESDRKWARKVLKILERMNIKYK